MTQNKKDLAKKQIKFLVEKRVLTGKKVKQLRKKGLVPGNIYGDNFTSISIQFPLADFRKMYKKTGGTNIVHLQLGEEIIPALVHAVQNHPVTDAILHVDFRKINLSKKIETSIPIKIVGESEAVAQNKGILLSLANEVVVESLPANIPSSIEVNISVLKELNQEIKIKDLPSSEDYIYKENPEKVIVRITAHKEESVESQVASPESVEVTTEKKDETVTPTPETIDDKKDDQKNEQTS